MKRFDNTWRLKDENTKNAFTTALYQVLEEERKEEIEEENTE